MEYNINDLRKQLDEIDKKLATLFERRMEVIEKVRICKLQNNMPILDTNRENNMKKNNNAYIENKEFVPYYERFLTSCTTISKDYMKDKNAKQK